LQYDVNGVVHMYPDFTRDRLAYRLETPWGHLYEFELHHASRTQVASEAQREDLLMRGEAEARGGEMDERQGVTGVTGVTWVTGGNKATNEGK